MNKLDERQKKFIMGAGIAAIIAAIVSIGITIGRGGSLSISIPMLLVISGLMLLLFAKKA